MKAHEVKRATVATIALNAGIQVQTKVGRTTPLTMINTTNPEKPWNDIELRFRLATRGP